MSVGIVNYDAGNIESVRLAVERLGETPAFVSTPEQVLAAERLILPGVGAAGQALDSLRRAHLDEALDEAVRKDGKPLLGICLGMQVLAENLFEFGRHAGLGWLSGNVEDLRQIGDPRLRVPHMGWNGVHIENDSFGFFDDIGGMREFYFAHSFALRANEPRAVAATVEYGKTLIAAVQFDTVFATQFHPEKSHTNGEKLLRRFLSWSP